MDTTETYIKMCEKAEKIQNQWKPLIGDYIGGTWFIDKEDNLGLCFLGIVKRLNPEGKTDCVDCGGDIFWAIESNVWLPRQDQLQEMAFTAVSGTYNKLPTKVFAFADYWEENGIPTMFNSLEQLWLAFVMRERWNKVWDGEKWVEDAKE